MANHTDNVPVASTEQENNTEEGARHPGDTSPGDINKNDYESMIQKKNIAKVNAVQFHFQWKVNKISYLTCTALNWPGVHAVHGEADAALAGAGRGLEEVPPGLAPRRVRPPAAGRLGAASDRAEHLGYQTTQEVGSITIYLGDDALKHIFDIFRYNVGIQVMAVIVVGINVFTTGFVWVDWKLWVQGGKNWAK